ncbi:hypothetical protein [Pedobacter rhizosphaerae]|uniref:Uncharacterized protein n=1 Tax=Pedobacter rhizosphaerae TaxID=390241 RepID=A0A1H9PRU4_9SPHI|nr:hypothetical protein [Pedobacter rhizosphaerae]SER50947.1 hypothetical protein SAMN04488023_11083 [Pedobacter rhizosphaerae]
MKAKVIAPGGGLFRSHKAYSPEEILASGGTTAFGVKSGKNNQTLIEALKNSPSAEPFSDKEWEDTFKP